MAVPRHLNSPEGHLERMAAVGRLLLTSKDIDDVLASVAQGMCEVSGLARSMIVSYDSSTQCISGRIGHGLDYRTFQGVQIPISAAPMAVRAIRTGRPQLTHHPLPDDPTLASYLQAYGVGTLVTFPLQSEQLGTLGLAFLDDDGGDFELDDETMRSLTTFAELASLAVQNAELTTRSQRLSALMERSRVAQEIHDSITQSLFGLRLELDDLLQDTAIPATVHERLVPLRERAQAAVEDMHRTLHALTDDGGEPGSPTQSTDVSVRLEEAFHASLEAHDLAGDLKFTGSGKDPDNAVGDLMVRLVEESLRNVARYADASEVVVHVRRSDRWWTVEVSDDGTGDPSVVRRQMGRHTPGFGLVGLQHEASHLGGRVWIREARRLSGLCVSLAVPVDS